MSISLILFFGSFLGIILMIGKKLFVLRGVETHNSEDFSFEVPDLEDIKYIAVKKAKRYGYVALVITLRSYIRSSNFLKKTGVAIYEKTKKRFQNNKNSFAGDAVEKREVSKFLKMVSEYKQKIGKIKHRIKEEEKLK